MPIDVFVQLISMPHKPSQHTFLVMLEKSDMN